ncbi:hypothetical protein AAII07_56440 [Microvirga sp. 0TCS3.31]
MPKRETKVAKLKEDYSLADALFASEVRDIVRRAVEGREVDEDAPPDVKRVAAAFLAIQAQFARMQAADIGVLEALSLINALLDGRNHPVWKFLRGSTKGRAAGNPAPDANIEMATAWVSGAIRAIKKREQANKTEACRIFHQNMTDDPAVADLKRSVETIRCRVRRFDLEAASHLKEAAEQWRVECLAGGRDGAGIVALTEAEIQANNRLPRLSEITRRRPTNYPLTTAEYIEEMRRRVEE